MSVLAIALLPALAAGNPSSEIVNGKPVANGALPFIVSLQSPSPKAPDAFRDHFCGGSLIDPTHVLTAAHCVWDGSKAIAPTKLRVLVGATRLRESAHRSGQLLTVDRIEVHPKYGKNDAYDVAVIRLKNPATAGQFIALPAAGDPSAERAGMAATVAGWGSTRRDGGSAGDRTSYPRQMRQTSIPIVANGKCATEYRKAGIRNLNTRTAICAGGQHRDSCYGDSGGPLFTQINGAPMQVGIVSWGIGCGRMDYPGIYTRTSNPEISSFIQKELGQ
ncbi:MAG: serine protease [Thermomicrobiales bacterium]